MEIHRNYVQGLAGMLVLLACSSAGFAQSAPPPPDSAAAIPGDRDFVSGPIGPAGDAAIEFLSFERALEGKVIKGAPYAGQAVTETVQVLADGNRIDRKMTASVFRDSPGRTRREESLPAIGPWAAFGQPPQVVFINDPVAGVHYILEPQDKIARKSNPASPGGPEAWRMIPGAKLRQLRQSQASQVTTESLGRQVMEGVAVEGTRVTHTILAGQIGNERPIVIVTERWFSPDLQVVVMSKRSDPRMGETTYHLTNISRNEPAASLFEVPAEYTVMEGASFPRHLEKRLQE